jgi:hypothetical protein
MAVADELVILVRAEVAKAQSDLKNTQKQVDNTKDSASKFSKFMGSPAGFAAGIAAAGLALGKLVKVGADLYNAYAVQERAVITLNTALANNELITDGASERFQAFATSLQRTSIYGDEVTISLIGQLAALGRTEDEIKKIVKTSADYSSATGKDFIQTALNLSNTMSGVAGQFGRADGEIRGLTEAQLKNGDAIDIIAKKYDGFAEKVGDTAFGSVKKLTGAIGDLKESFGKDVAEYAKPLLDVLTQIIIKETELRDLRRTAERNAGSIAKVADLVALGRERDILSASAALSIDQLEQAYAIALAANPLATRQQQAALEALEKIIITAKKAREEAARVGTAAAPSSSGPATVDRNKQALALQSEALKKIDELELASRRYANAFGEVVDYQKLSNLAWAEAEKLITESNGLISQTNPIYKDLVMLAQAYAKLSGDTRDEYEEIVPVIEEILKNYDDIYQVMLDMEEADSRWAEGLDKIHDKTIPLVKIWNDLEEAVGKYADQIGVAQGALTALGDYQKNQSDQYLNSLKEQRDEMKKNGKSTEEIDAFILKKKNEFAEKEFKSRKATAIAQAGIDGAGAVIKSLTLDPTGILALFTAGLAATQIGLIAGKKYVPMAQGGIATGPTRALIGEAGPEAVIPLRDMDKGFQKADNPIVINQYISGSIWQTKELEGLAVGAVARSRRGY